MEIQTMPNMAAITVKKFDGTTDVTYTNLNPSAGDRTKALWRVESIGTIAGNRPILEIQSKASNDGRFRIVEGKLTMPETFVDSTTGITAVRTRDMLSFTSSIDLTGADATHNELAAQAANLLKSALIQSVITTGFAPN